MENNKTDLEGMTHRWSQGDGCSIILLILIPLLYFFPLLFFDKLIPAGDWYHLFYPIRELIHHQFQSGEFPLWNHYIFLGVPLFATWQPAVLYPLNLIFIVFEPITAMKWVSAINLIIAGIGMFLFTRIIIRFSTDGALISAIIFMLNGYLAAHFEHINQINTMVWIPLLLLFYHGSVLGFREHDLSQKIWNWDKKIGYGIGGGLILAIQIFAGHPQILFYSLLILVFYFISLIFYFIRSKKSGYVISAVLSLFLVLLIAIGLSAIQWIPSMELSGQSLRILDTYQYAVFSSFPPKQHIGWLLPNYFGSATGNYIGESNFSEMTIYSGILTLFLVFLSIPYYRLRHNNKLFLDSIYLFLILLFLTGIILSLGKYNPLYPLFYKIIYPLQLFRCPSRILLLSIFAISIFAGFGWQYLTKFRNANCRFPIKISWIIWIGVGFIMISLLLIFVFSCATGKTDYFFKLRMHDFWTLLTIVISFYLIFYLYKSKILSATPTFFLLLLLILGDLFYFSRDLSFRHLMERNRLELSNPIRDKIRSINDTDYARLFRLTDEINYGNLEYSIIRKRIKRLQPNLNIPYRIPDLFGYEEGLLPTWNYLYYIHHIRSKIFSPLPDSELLGSLNIRYLLADKPVYNPQFQLIGQFGDLELFENKDYLPYIYWVPEVHWVDNREKMMDKILTPNFYPRNQAIFLNPNISPNIDEHKGIIPRQSAIYNPQSNQIQYRFLSSIEIEINTFTQSSGYLLIGQAYYPGWKAKLNGHQTALYLANGILHGIQLPPGNNQILFYYQPDSFQLGLFITLLTIILLLFLIMIYLIIKMFLKINKKI